MNVFEPRFGSYAAAILTVTIWAAYLLGTRYAVSSNFSVEEILILRIVPAAIILSPVMLKFGVVPPRGTNVIGVFMLTVGASALFPYFLSSALQFAPASDAGILAPGTLPFWAALSAFLLMGDRPNKVRQVGLLCIIAGALSIAIWEILLTSSNGTWRGHLMFMSAAAFWSVYSVYFKMSGLSPLHALSIGTFWAFIALVVFISFRGNADFSGISINDIFMMALLQGIFVGLISTVLYSYAVTNLGPAKTGAVGALTPVLTLLGGWLFLGEGITANKLAGMILVTFGVMLASGVVKTFKRSA
jgi:drug/metabolite transporter (DMT)-like permease